MARFVHLHCHSEYSLIDGLVRIKPLVKTVAEQGMAACALTDHHNLFALVKFYQAAQGAGIKPIIGVDMWLYQADAPPTQLLLLCQNEEGYRNLTRLVSRSYMEGQVKGRPFLRAEWLDGATEGLIALIAGRQSDIGMALVKGHPDQAANHLRTYQHLFPQRHYLELVRTGRAEEEDYLHAAVEFATQHQVPVVATNDVRFLKSSDFEAHEVRVSIHDGYVLADPNRPRLYSEQQYLRSPEEMAELFADIPEALENTWHIAQRCNVTLTLGKNYLPNFPIPDGKTVEDYFREQCRLGLEDRLADLFDTDAPEFAQQRKPYDERLEIELNVILQMGFPGYFLIVADFIQWAKDNGIPVGPGRGSGAGSLVAYALKITDLDPLPYDLLFERFLNPERVSMPDFDIDFCMERRDEVISYVADYYGRDKVSQIITYGSMAAKAVVRDVGRVLDHPYGFVDKLAKLIPFEIGITLDKALAAEEALRTRYEQEEDVRELLDMARKLEGLTRNVGKHAGGVVISPSVLTDFSPLYCEEDGSNLVTQFDKGDVESVGLVKFDFLGLRTLTIIRWALDIINQFRDEPLDINTLPLDDPLSYELFQKANTTAVFQLESRGMKELLKKLKPTCFEDIIALLALYRPGPIESGMVDDFITRKNDPNSQFDYLHEELNSNAALVAVLKPTYGVIAYQEQVMQIAQVLAGYSLGGADLLRRAMGKKKPEEMAKQRSTFVDGSVANGIQAETAGYVFDLVEKFAGYGFNKSVGKDTKVFTSNGIKPIKDCVAGDQVLSRTPAGESVYSTVVALHDHGLTPLWEIEFDDGTRERCTLDHKWLTEDGQQPLWKILQMGGKVWGCAAYTTGDEGASENLSSLRGLQTEISVGGKMWRGASSQARSACSSEGMPRVYEHDSHGAFCGQRQDYVLWDSCENPQSGQRTLSAVRSLPTDSPRHSSANLQRFRTHAGNAREIFSDSQANLGTSRNTSRTCPAFESVARQPSRGVSSDSGQSACSDETLENGNVVRTAFSGIGVHPQYTNTLSTSTQTSRFFESATENGDRSGWPVAFYADPIGATFADRTSERSSTGSGDSSSILALNPTFDALFQKWLWRTYLSRTDGTARPNQRWQLDGDTVLRQPIRATFLGWHQSYDLEVDHPEHNFLLASGLCCSNSHSAAYALVSYQTAWLKAHHPAAFMAAVLSSDMDNTDKVVNLIDECRQMQLKVLPPDVNVSDYKFTVNDDQNTGIRYGLGAIKGVGEGAILGIIEERKANGIYDDLFEFCRRIDLRKANRRVLEALIKAGALDGLGPERGVMMASLDTAIKLAEKHAADQNTGQNDLFGLLGGGGGAQHAVQEDKTPFSSGGSWTEEQRLSGEKDSLGLYLTGHPINRFLTELEKLAPTRLKNVRPTEKFKTTKVAGLVLNMRTLNSRRGRMASLVLDDNTARLEVMVYSDRFEEHKALLIKDSLLIIEGEIREDEFSGGGYSMVATNISSLEMARERQAKQLVVKVEAPREGWVDDFLHALQNYRTGSCPIAIHYRREDAVVELVLGADWQVRPEDALLAQLSLLVGLGRVEVRY